MKKVLRLDYNDNPIDIIDKVNAVLAAEGLEFVDDGKEHDGFCLFELRRKEATSSP